MQTKGSYTTQDRTFLHDKEFSPEKIHRHEQASTKYKVHVCKCAVFLTEHTTWYMAGTKILTPHSKPRGTYIGQTYNIDQVCSKYS